MVTTSGTSGQPKGVVLTHEAVAASARATTARLRVDPSRHVWLACLPLAHIGGLSVVTRAIITGTPVLVLPGFEADTVEAVGRTGRASHVALVATALRRLDASVFSCVLLGGSKAPDVLPSNVVSTFGMTETGSGVVYDGTPLDGVDLALRPSDGMAAVGTDDRTGGEILGPRADAVPVLPRRDRRAGGGTRRRGRLVRHRRRRASRLPTGR